MKAILYSLFVSLLTVGCTSLAPSQQRLQSRIDAHSQRLTTGIVDVLQLQSTEQRDVYSATALELARQDQRLEGLPIKPFDAWVLTQSIETPASREAWADLRAEFKQQDKLLAAQRRKAAKLETMGAAYERERNERITAWAKWLSGGLVGIGGLIALFIFFPVALPLAGRFLAWLVGKLPSLAGAAGVVSVKAFDAVVRGVERAREAGSGGELLNNQSASVVPAVPATNGYSRRHSPGSSLELSLSRSMDADHKALVRARKHTLALA